MNLDKFVQFVAFLYLYPLKNLCPIREIRVLISIISTRISRIGHRLERFKPVSQQQKTTYLHFSHYFCNEIKNIKT
jgi:hypothetical protein